MVYSFPSVRDEERTCVQNQDCSTDQPNVPAFVSPLAEPFTKSGSALFAIAEISAFSKRFAALRHCDIDTEALVLSIV
jgi:hypothetical protein